MSKEKKTKLFIREQTYELLREKLLSGHFSPSERLTEESLASGLGVSRTPIREALHRLESEGLVTVTGKRGYSVPEHSREEAEELFEIRGILEGHALSTICVGVAFTTLDALRQIIDDSEEALRNGDYQEIVDLNTRFHDLLYTALAEKKPRLYRMIEDMREYTLKYRRHAIIRRQGVERSISGHKRILLALELKDPLLCERIMRTHVSEARNDYFNSLKL